MSTKQDEVKAAKTRVGHLVRKVARQSQTRERLRRILQKAIPDFDFTEYPILYLHPSRREGDRPAWSVGARRKSDGLLVDVYSQDRMTDVIALGASVRYELWDRAIEVFPTYNQEG